MDNHDNILEIVKRPTFTWQDKLVLNVRDQTIPGFSMS